MIWVRRSALAVGVQMVFGDRSGRGGWLHGARPHLLLFKCYVSIEHCVSK